MKGKAVLLGCLLFGFGNLSTAAEQLKALNLAVWGGSHGAMLDHAVLTPFTALTNVNLQSRTRLNVEWSLDSDNADVVELELQEAIDACDSGELSLLPGAELDDFVPNAVQPCAVAQFVWSTVYAYDPGAYKSGHQPSLISDFFNVIHYPGRRAVKRSSRVLSEWSLLAAGIPASAIYETLSQPDLAWQIIERTLEPIAHTIVWVDDDDQALEMLQDGAVSFAMVGSDTLLRAVVAGADNLQPVWDGSVNHMSLWAIPVNSSNPELAWQFVRFATSVDATRRFSSVSGYGPSRYSSLDQIGRDYHEYLPSERSNLRNVIWGDSSWWRAQGKSIDIRFVNWLSNQFVKSDS